MLELTKEQMEAIQKAISKKAEESVQEFDKELDVVVSNLSTEGWTLPAELNIYAVKTIANTNKLDDINAFLKWFFTTEDFQKTKDMVNGIKASPIKEGLKNLTDQCWQAFQNKLYAVCATSLLSVIEGILSEFSDDMTCNLSVSTDRWTCKYNLRREHQCSCSEPCLRPEGNPSGCYLCSYPQLYPEDG